MVDTCAEKRVNCTSLQEDWPVVVNRRGISDTLSFIIDKQAIDQGCQERAWKSTLAAMSGDDEDEKSSSFPVYPLYSQSESSLHC